MSDFKGHPAPRGDASRASEDIRVATNTPEVIHSPHRFQAICYVSRLFEQRAIGTLSVGSPAAREESK